MEKAFRWGCIVLFLVTLGAWALLLHQSNQPWKLIGLNETSDADGQTRLAYEKQPGKQNALAGSKSNMMPPGEGSRSLDSIIVQQQHQKQDTFDIHDARMFFMGPGPVAPKTRHHRSKKCKDTDADSSAEEKADDGDNTVSSGNDAAANAAWLAQTLIVANAWPSTSTLLPNGGSTVTSPVIKTTQTVVERISAPIVITVNDLTQGITSMTQPRLQGLVSSAPSTISQATSPVTTTVNNISASPLQTLTTQTLNTLSSPTSTVPSVTSLTSTVGSPVSNVGISPTSSTPTTSTPTLVPTTIATVTTVPLPTSVANFGSSVSGPVSNISSSVPTSGPTSVSSSLLGPTASLPKALSRGR